jgi:glycosyltransferase involved in cell wall biosynthesis
MKHQVQAELEKTGKPTVTAVVPCRNEASHIEACLRSILNQEELPGGFEVIVADGMSNDGTREILQRMEAANPRLHVMDNPSRITPCGMNVAIRAGRGEWLAVMGAHNQYAPDYLRRCLETARESRADNVGGAMVAEGQTYIQRAIAATHHSAFSTGGARWHNPAYEGPADTVFGGFYRRDILDRIGLFDEELVRNQDDELNLRLTRAGGRIWQSPSIKSWYRPRRSLSALFRQYTQYGYWKVRVIQKHKVPASWRHLVPGGFLLALCLLVLLSSLEVAFQHFCDAPAAVYRWPAMGLCLLVGAYLVALLTASIQTAKKKGWLLLPVLPVVLGCYHFGYGYGFLHGIWDFHVHRKNPALHFGRLTRTGPQPDNADKPR